MKTVKFLSFALAIAGAATASATPVSVGELGDLRGSAFNLDPYFSTPPPSLAFGSNPTATVFGSLETGHDLDWFRFSGTAGWVLGVDVDNSYSDLIDPVPDQVVSVFRSDGTLLAFDDDSLLPLDPGTDSDLDSYVGLLTLPATETYYIALSSAPNYPTVIRNRTFTSSTSLTRPDGGYGGDLMIGVPPGDDSFQFDEDLGYTGNYRFHVSVGDLETAGDPTVPEPTTMVGGLALAGLIGGRALRRKKKN